MSRLLTRIVAAVLVPCLIADPGRATVLLEIFPGSPAARNLESVDLFTRQALALPEATAVNAHGAGALRWRHEAEDALWDGDVPTPRRLRAINRKHLLYRMLRKGPLSPAWIHRIQKTLRHVSQLEFEQRLERVTLALNSRLVGVPSYAVVFDLAAHKSKHWVYHLARPFLSELPAATLFLGDPRVEDLSSLTRTIVIFDDSVITGSNLDDFYTFLLEPGTRILLAIPYVTRYAYNRIKKKKDVELVPGYQIVTPFIFFDHKTPDYVHAAAAHGRRSLKAFRALDSLLPPSREPYKVTGTRYWEFEEEEYWRANAQASEAESSSSPADQGSQQEPAELASSPAHAVPSDRETGVDAAPSGSDSAGLTSQGGDKKQNFRQTTNAAQNSGLLEPQSHHRRQRPIPTLFNSNRELAFADGRQSDDRIKSPNSKIEPPAAPAESEQTLRQYLSAHQHPGGPVQMIVDEFNSGTQLVLLDDPHPETQSSPYRDFLEVLIQRLVKESGLSKIIIEAPPDFLKEYLMPFIQAWSDSGKKDLRSFMNSLPKSKAKAFASLLYPFAHGLEFLKAAHDAHVPVIGIDPRGIALPNGHEIGNFDLPVAGGETDLKMAQAIMAEVRSGSNQDKILAILGGHHIARTPALKRTGYWVSRAADIRTATVLVELAWGEHQNRLEEALYETELPVVATKDLTTRLGDYPLEPLPSIQFGTYDDFILPIKTHDVVTKDFDRLIFFRDFHSVQDLCRLEKERPSAAPPDAPADHESNLLTFRVGSASAFPQMRGAEDARICAKGVLSLRVPFMDVGFGQLSQWDRLLEGSPLRDQIYFLPNGKWVQQIPLREALISEKIKPGQIYYVRASPGPEPVIQVITQDDVVEGYTSFKFSSQTGLSRGAVFGGNANLFFVDNFLQEAIDEIKAAEPGLMDYDLEVRLRQNWGGASFGVEFGPHRIYERTIRGGTKSGPDWAVTGKFDESLVEDIAQLRTAVYKFAVNLFKPRPSEPETFREREIRTMPEWLWVTISRMGVVAFEDALETMGTDAELFLKIFKRLLPDIVRQYETKPAIQAELLRKSFSDILEQMVVEFVDILLTDPEWLALLDQFETEGATLMPWRSKQNAAPIESRKNPLAKKSTYARYPRLLKLGRIGRWMIEVLAAPVVEAREIMTMAAMLGIGDIDRARELARAFLQDHDNRAPGSYERRRVGLNKIIDRTLKAGRVAHEPVFDLVWKVPKNPIRIQTTDVWSFSPTWRAWVTVWRAHLWDSLRHPKTPLTKERSFPNHGAQTNFERLSDHSKSPAAPTGPGEEITFGIGMGQIFYGLWRTVSVRVSPTALMILYGLWRYIGGFAIGYWTAMHVAYRPGFLNFALHPSFDIGSLINACVSTMIPLYSYALHYRGHVLFGRLAGARSRLVKEEGWEQDVFEGGTDVQRIAHLLGGPGINLITAGVAWLLMHFGIHILPNLLTNILNDVLLWNLTMGVGALAPLWWDVGGLLILRLTWRIIRNSVTESGPAKATSADQEYPRRAA